MANLQVDLPMPALNGAGAAVDVSGMGKLKTFVCVGAFPGAKVTVEGSCDGGTTYAPIVAFNGRAGRQKKEVVCDHMRAYVQGRVAGAAFAANLDVGANDNGAEFETPALPALNGAGAAVDISAYGSFATFICRGTNFAGATVLVEISEDGVDYAPLVGFSSPGGFKNKQITGSHIRARVQGRHAGDAFDAVLAVGFANDPISATSASTIWATDGTATWLQDPTVSLQFDSGGNARGQNAVDLQVRRDAADQVAAASDSFIGGGGDNKIDAAASFSSAFGRYSDVDAYGLYSQVMGLEGDSRWRGAHVLANGNFAEHGDAESFEVVARARSSDTNPHVLTLDGVEPAAAPNSLVLSDDEWYCWLFEARLVTGRLQAAVPNMGAWILRCAIARDGAGTGVTIRGPIDLTTLVNDFGDTVTLVENDTLSSVEIQVTPADGTARRWVAHCRITAMKMEEII